MRVSDFGEDDSQVQAAWDVSFWQRLCWHRRCESSPPRSPCRLSRQTDSMWRGVPQPLADCLEQKQQALCSFLSTHSTPVQSVSCSRRPSSLSRHVDQNQKSPYCLSSLIYICPVFGTWKVSLVRSLPNVQLFAVAQPIVTAGAALHVLQFTRSPHAVIAMA